jgi:hypothetical protein
VATADFTGATWRKSSRSSGAEDDNCVEVAFSAGAVGVRDSKNRAGTHLVFSERVWDAMNASFRALSVRNEAFMALGYRNAKAP